MVLPLLWCYESYTKLCWFQTTDNASATTYSKNKIYFIHIFNTSSPKNIFMLQILQVLMGFFYFTNIFKITSYIFCSLQSKHVFKNTTQSFWFFLFLLPNLPILDFKKIINSVIPIQTPTCCMCTYICQREYHLQTKFHLLLLSFPEWNTNFERSPIKF